MTQIYPSEIISDYIKLNIHKEYNFDYNCSDEYYKTIRKLYFNDNNIDILKKLSNNYYKEYQKLNLIKNQDKYFDLLMGVLSKFNEYDIKFFIDEWNVINNFTEMYICYFNKTFNKTMLKNSTRKRQLYDIITNNFEKYFDMHIGYIMSPFTFNLINDEYKVMNKDKMNKIFNKICL